MFEVQLYGKDQMLPVQK